MNINEWAAEIHRNAVEHGWWEQKRPDNEVLELVVCELAEAIEEDRADRPPVWRECKVRCDGCLDDNGQLFCMLVNCPSGYKPEGIHVELIDAAIRILDYVGMHIDPQTEGVSIRELAYDSDSWFNLTELVMHCLINIVEYAQRIEKGDKRLYPLIDVCGMIFRYVIEEGGDPEAIMSAKHEFNKGRPYKHGKRY